MVICGMILKDQKHCENQNLNYSLKTMDIESLVLIVHRVLIYLLQCISFPYADNNRLRLSS